MKLLLLGSGGREHAFAWKLSQSARCDKLFIAPGNAGTAALGTNVDLDPNDFAAIADFCLQEGIDRVVVGPEEPLVRGIYDHFSGNEELRSIKVFGPGRKGALLEGSKAHAKAFMARHGIPTAAYREFGGEQLAEGLTYLDAIAPPFVLKADGLAAGKGVLILQDRAEAKAEFRAMLGGKFGEAGKKVVVEAFLDGIEFSVFAITDGRDYRLLPVAKDYKRIGEGDTGLNTGGMGAISPVPFVDEALLRKVEDRIVRPTIKGLQQENIPYFGFVFFGLIRVGEDPYVIEYNCRMGDPETEVVFPRLQTDLLELMESCWAGTLGEAELPFDPRAAATVILVSGGYPGSYEKGKPIRLPAQLPDSLLFHAGTRNEGGRTLTNGGRVLAITSLGEDFKAALQTSYQNIDRIAFEGMYYRKDIGFDL